MVLVYATDALSSLRNVPTIKVMVGASQDPFHLHKDIFCEVSSFFRAALTGAFREANDQTVSLLEEDLDTFEKFVQWVYTKSFTLASADAPEEMETRYLALARLFVLADKLQVPALRNKTIFIMYQTFDSAKWLPNTTVLNYVYNATQAKCGLRRLLVAVYVWQINHEWYDRDGCVDDLLKLREFSAELAIAFAHKISHPERSDPFIGPVDETQAAKFYDNDPNWTTFHHAMANTPAD